MQTTILSLTIENSQLLVFLGVVIVATILLYLLTKNDILSKEELMFLCDSVEDLTQYKMKYDQEKIRSDRLTSENKKLHQQLANYHDITLKMDEITSNIETKLCP